MSDRIRFEHKTDGVVLDCVAQYDAGDPSVGIWPGWFLIRATTPTKDTYDRDEFTLRFGSSECYRVEEHAENLAGEIEDNARAEMRGSRQNE